MEDMDEVYAIVERCRRKLLGYSITNEEARKEAWAAEDELYELEELMLKWDEESHAAPTLL
jgi:hypothetical protein